MISVQGVVITKEFHEDRGTIIYYGHHKESKETVMVKCSPRVRRLRRQYELLCDLKGEGTVDVFSFEEIGDEAAMVMGYGGVSIDFFLLQRPLEITEKITWMLEILSALDKIHEHQIIHHGLNFSNILLDEKNKKINIIDFSAASTVQNQFVASVLQGLDEKLFYTSPERVGRTSKQVDRRSDYYSLGVVFYRLLTGQLPFNYENTLEVVHAHIARVPKKLCDINPEISPVLSDIVLKLLEKDPDNRYQSIFGLKKDLEACLEQLISTRTIAEFSLGQHDIISSFQLPDKSYGRSKEKKQFLETIYRATQNDAEVFMVTGPPGIGKSEFVDDFKDVMFENHGYFIKGLFEELNQNVPYSGLIQAFESLIKQILAENPQIYHQWQEELLQALEPNAQVLIDFSPSLGTLLGSQPASIEVDTQAARDRFNLTLCNFFNAIAKASHPIVLFLDDLHWADGSSLNLLNMLLQRVDRRYFLLVGAYCDVGAQHPLMELLKVIHTAGFAVTTLKLTPLPFEDVQELLSDTLRTHKDELKELAQNCLEKTQGNPFFLKQLLLQLYQDKLFIFDQKEKIWKWDIKVIHGISISDNVADFITDKIKTLPKEVQSLLRWGSCIGREFDEFLLERVSKLSPEEMKKSLEIAVKEGSIFLFDDVEHYLEIKGKVYYCYGFSHIRAQQAIYNEILETDRQMMHITIGRVLLNMERENIRAVDVTIIVGHFNQGLNNITDTQEKVTVSELNLEAGKKSRQNIAYQIAFDYFKCGISLLEMKVWNEDYLLAYSLYSLAMDAAYLIANYKEMDNYGKIILAYAKDEFDKLDVYRLKAALCSSQGDFEKAIDYGFSGVATMGFKFNKKPNMLQVLWWLFRFNVVLFGKTPEQITSLPKATNRAVEAALSLLADIGIAMYFADLNLVAIVTFKGARLNLKYGMTPDMSMALVGYAVMLSSILKDPKKGYKYGTMALKVVDQYNMEKYKGRIYFLYYSNVLHWNEPVANIIEGLKESFKKALQVGDLIYAGFAAYNCVTSPFIIGKPISFVIEEARKYIAILENINQKPPRDHILFFLKLCLKLQGYVDPLIEDACAKFLEEERRGEIKIDNAALHSYFFGELLAAYFLKDVENAYQHARKLLGYVEKIRGLPIEGPCYFYAALSFLAYYPLASRQEKKQVLKLFNECFKKISFWKNIVPENYLHRYYLLFAQKKVIFGRKNKAIKYFEQAISLAKQNRYKQEEAIANELLAKVYFTKSRNKVASLYLKEASAKYQQWGAVIKVEQLEKEYPILSQTEGYINPVAEVASNEALLSSERFLDFEAILEFAKTLSEEIVLDNLLIKLMQILLVSSGSQRSLLLLEKDNNWYIEAEGELEKEKRVLQSLPLEGMLAESLIQYVIHSKTPLVLENAYEDNQFVKDSYIQKYKVKSLLCMPLLNHGILRGILYLENNAIQSAFTTKQLNLLNMLSGQIIVSIDNARLYTDTAKLNKTLSNLNETLLDTNKAYARFVPQELLQLLGKKDITQVKLGDQLQREMTILFSDIRGFTTLSEKMTPDESFHFVNQVLSYLEPAIASYGGFIDKYLGDGLMALFPSSADAAVQASIAMLYAIESFNEVRIKEDKPAIRIGIGLNTGLLMLGTVGGVDRMDATVISDTVNAASRVEELTKDYKVWLLITSETYQRLVDKSAYSMRELWIGSVRGKSEVTTVYEVFDADLEKHKALKQQTRQDFEAGVKAYSERSWQKAEAAFNRVLTINTGDTAALSYLRQCKEKQINRF